MEESLEPGMPQPLSRVSPNAEIQVSSAALTSQPEFAAAAMRVIGIWSEIEGDLALILSRMLKADIETGVAIYQALSGGEARKAAFLAAAETALAEWQMLLLRAVLNSTRGSRNQRNDFAHHVWGSTKALPNAILLMAPSVVLDRHLSFFQARPVPGSPATLLTPKDFDYSRVYVYRQSDFRRAVLEALDASVAYGLLYGVLGRPVIEQARRQLLHEPRVQQALEPLIRESSPEVREILRPPVDDEPPPKGLLPETWI